MNIIIEILIKKVKAELLKIEEIPECYRDKVREALNG